MRNMTCGRILDWRRVGTAAALIILPVAAAYAHDFWLVPDAFEITPGDSLIVAGQTSSEFPESESAVTTDRIAEARLVGPRTDEPIQRLGRRDRSLLLAHRPSAPGQYLIGVTLRPRTVRESAAGFLHYLELEGASGARAQIQRERLLSGVDSVTRRYAKYAKTIIQSGRGGGRTFDRGLGHPLEFILTTDPDNLRAGDTLTVRVLYRGRPLPGLHAHAGWVDWPVSRDTGRTPAHPGHSIRSDSTGELLVPVAHAGLWNVRAIHIDRAPRGEGADWDTHWATFVFLVRQRYER